ncbi:immunoglobulin-like and fibronectin type III domain-containing protein 1 isoform X1 [Apostichopus japonicus]|uniref:immunoglobulin-like and fibronectin type III domain-containing protein 1 isoform X1 n=1 Tax=Stichopus japonicus TaxID=307972 RepID=UPI003AB79EBF
MTLATSGGESSSSDEIYYYVPRLPEYQAAPTVIHVSSDSLTVNWPPWDGVIGTPPVVEYRLFTKESESEDWPSTFITVNASDDQEMYSVMMTPFEPDTEYDFRVTAVRGGPNGDGTPGPVLIRTKTYCRDPGITPTNAYSWGPTGAYKCDLDVILFCETLTTQWDTWTIDRDQGIPPIIAYVLYHKNTSSSQWQRGENVKHNASMETHFYQFENLIECTLYNFSIAVVREGYGGEGYPREHTDSPACNKGSRCNQTGEQLALRNMARHGCPTSGYTFDRTGKQG